MSQLPGATVVVTEALEGLAVDHWGRIIADALAGNPKRLEQVFEIGGGMPAGAMPACTSTASFPDRGGTHRQ
jgi:hypothetical protein